MGENTTLQFLPFMSTIESGFWSKLADSKLNIYKLDDSRKELSGFYTNTDVKGLPCRHNVEYAAFENLEKPPPLCFLSHGGLYNKNTIEDFKSCNKKSLLNHEADILWDSIVNGDAIKNPDLLVRFSLLSFADLKKFMFYYWFAFPAFVHSPSISIDKNHSKLLGEIDDGKFSKLLQNAVDVYRQNHGIIPGFFLICSSAKSSESMQDEITLSVHRLIEFEQLFEEGLKIIFGFCDPSTLPEYPGWPLRNFLTLISYHWAKKLNGTLDVVCFRDRTQGGVRSTSHSLCLTVNLSPITERPTDATGWEKDKKNRLRPRCVDLADNMDPTRLAESSVGLNLKLMRWRLMPALDLEKISGCKCLLLGSGTLGCNVARGLLGWGVGNITMVDYGEVSFSNPVRQTLFEFSDCGTSGGRSKAEAAAERLKKIYPCVNATGVRLSVPMPGHPVHSSEELVAKVKEDVEKLDKLIESSDVIFLLMDTRESRWLPTLLSAAKRKFVINAALGFDSYLVMRHGVISSSSDDDLPPPPDPNSSEVFEKSLKLGCYFCNDVVAPGNSLRDRTLDQQCTVSRPGVSMIASALAVELMASTLQHPLGPLAYPDPTQEETGSCLGPVPHQIRGFLSHNKVFYPATEAFSKCTACSDLVLEAYQSKGFDFLLDVFNSPHSYLEDLTGLTLLHQQTASAESEVLEFSDSESI